MTNIGSNTDVLDLSNMVEKARQEAKEEAEIRAIVGDATDYEKAQQLPHPSGYRILCAIPEQEKETEKRKQEQEKKYRGERREKKENKSQKEEQTKREEKV